MPALRKVDNAHAERAAAAYLLARAITLRALAFKDGACFLSQMRRSHRAAPSGPAYLYAYDGQLFDDRNRGMRIFASPPLRNSRPADGRSGH